MKLRNIIVNNLKLLNDDISKAFIRIQSAPSAKKDYLANENKKEVLYMYRHMQIDVKRTTKQNDFSVPGNE